MPLPRYPTHKNPSTRGANQTAKSLHLQAQNHHRPYKLVTPLSVPLPSKIRDVLPHIRDVQICHVEKRAPVYPVPAAFLSQPVLVEVAKARTGGAVVKYAVVSV